MKLTGIFAAMLVVAAFAPLQAREWQVPAATGVIGVETAQLDPQYWIARQPDADKVVLDAAMIAKQNARLHALDRSLHDLDALPASLPREQVGEWVRSLSA
ncbi:MAG TPA: NlpC-P60 family protein, partial [Polyangia bacterium]